MAGDKIRVFVAVGLPEAARLGLSSLARKLGAAARGVRWTRPENLHFTLAFLGEQEPGRVDAVREASQEAALACKPFALRFGGLGAFPEKGRPRVIWIGLSQGADELTRLQSGLARALAQRGFALEERAFVPHLTLGRVADDARLADSAALLGQPMSWPEAVAVDRIRVMRSQLAPAGAVYTELHACPFGSGK